MARIDVNTEILEAWELVKIPAALKAKYGIDILDS